MNGLKLVIGSRYASSWSLRPWLLLKQLGLPFEEIVIPLRQQDTGLSIRRYSPSGKVPVLLADTFCIWDSLAIAEYLAEEHPVLWPDDRAARALARAACCEMHSGFAALRTFLPMDFTARFDPPGRLLAQVERDIERIVALWADCRRESVGRDPFLFGRFTVADAMFAPVCSRFTTYAVPLDRESNAYVGHIMALPAMQEWGRLAEAELTARERLPSGPPTTSAPVPRGPTPKAIETHLAAPTTSPATADILQTGPETGIPTRHVASATVPDEPRREPRPIPPTIMVKPIGDGTRRRR